MLKNFALLSIATSDGRVTITDNDLIEMSNLNRQFLFRKKDIRVWSRWWRSVSRRLTASRCPDAQVDDRCCCRQVYELGDEDPRRAG